ncbi:MAG: 30S ribosomal protein S20 [Actinomycetota bacterium]
MANIKSQIKRNKQAEVARQANKSSRSSLKTQIKSFVAAAESGEGDEKSLAELNKALDKAAAKGIIHKNKAANQKRRLAKKLTP